MRELFTVAEFASILKISPSTIYRNPSRFHMFKVGGAWRANEESVEKFSQTPNNVFRLAVVGKGVTKCRSTNEGKTTGLISRLQTELELDALLAPKRKRKLSSTTTR
ncbi:helix-turn-helix domain-containing protein [Pluralibacter sp.]|uniref:helix-turn-helix domain-containing protein n=1 Tax=Pluralibacter sp. TaxID=1920032 RepID=UPI00345CE512